ncbi:hypothetical protein HanXRQr2_Chr05g0225281 [Helianthus annuus]|uniref:Uncharacterized protein n=1 Tax=Helianthus annuus TaxID=4232 RepID=A0A9K3NPK3_HELAN|nr:hypothetical protein HanXRQr2_Chr05g0225281 [Helianthus annuus]
MKHFDSYEVAKQQSSICHKLMDRPVNELNVHELFKNLFGGKFVYLISERT